MLPENILTADELAARLKVTRGFITEKLRTSCANPIPVLKIGRYCRFHWPDVCVWLESASTAAKRRK